VVQWKNLWSKIAFLMLKFKITFGITIFLKIVNFKLMLDCVNCDDYFPVLL
jgi:hypothetical protein